MLFLEGKTFLVDVPHFAYILYEILHAVTTSQVGSVSPHTKNWLKYRAKSLPLLRAPPWKLGAMVEEPLARFGAYKPRPSWVAKMPTQHFAPSWEIHTAAVACEGWVGFLTHTPQSLTSWATTSSQSIELGTGSGPTPFPLGNDFRLK